MNKKIVVFGGGTGISYLVKGLKNFPVDITCVIAVSDNGSSTGKLREEFFMPAMGDIRQVIVNLSEANDKIKELLEYRYDTYTDLDGHAVGNLIMVAMYNITGSLKESIRVLSDFLHVSHKVLPLSEDYLTLMGETVDGDIISGEEAIGHEPRKIKRLFYDNVLHVDDEIISEINSADLVVFSIGSLYTSIVPHLLSDTIKNAIDSSKARILYTCNAVCQPFETDDYSVSDHISIINSYLGNRKIDAVLCSNSEIPDEIINKYVSNENKKLVSIDRENINCEIIEKDLLVIDDGHIRHDSLKLATAVFNYLME